MMKGIRSSAAVALLATAARAAEEVVEQVTEQVATQGPEAVKQAITNENAAGYLASALNALSQCPEAVKGMLDATVGNNPYARIGATAVTVAATVAVPFVISYTCFGKNKAAKPAKNPDSAANSNPSIDVTPPPTSAAVDTPVSAQPAVNDGSNHSSASNSPHHSGDEADDLAIGAEGQAYEDRNTKGKKNKIGQ